jgi:hypothetical protein
MVGDLETLPKTQRRRSSKCKICKYLPTAELDRFNYDITLRARNYNQTVAEFNQYLPDDVDPISYDNIKNHRAHINVKFIKETAGGPLVEVPVVQPQMAVTRVIELVREAERTNVLDKTKLLEFLYTDRLRHLAYLRERLAIVQQAFSITPSTDLDDKIQSYMRQISKLESSLTQDLLTHLQGEEDAREVQFRQLLAVKSRDFLKLVAVGLLAHFATDQTKIGIVLEVTSNCLSRVFGEEIGLADVSSK